MILQSDSDQNNTVLAEKQTSVEPNWDPRNKPTCVWTINLWQKSKEHTVEKG